MFLWYDFQTGLQKIPKSDFQIQVLMSKSSETFLWFFLINTYHQFRRTFLDNFNFWKYLVPVSMVSQIHYCTSLFSMYLLLKDRSLCYRFIFLGVIQSLRGPKYTQFWPSTLIKWSIKDILHTIYPLSRDPSWTFYWTPIPLFLST